MNKTLLWVLLGLACAAGFSGLGRWQLGRAQHKEAMLAVSARVLSERRPVSLATQADAANIAWARGSGHFVPGPALLLDNQRRGAAVGVRVFRVFAADTGAHLLVDLGWLAMPPERTLPVLPAADSRPQTVQGLLVPPPAAGFALGPDHVASDAGRWLLTRVDLSALSSALGTALSPRVLRLDPALPGGYARDLEMLSNTLTPEKHRGYALQWFGLAAASLITTLVLVFRGRSHDRN